MSEGKHTPGPWKAKMQRNRYNHDLGWIIEHGNGRIGWASLAYADTNSEATKSDPARKANALLIASAPDILEWAKSILAEHDAGGDISLASIGHLRSAVSKAEGRDE